jgi:hypothetical protein
MEITTVHRNSSGRVGWPFIIKPSELLPDLSIVTKATVVVKKPSGRQVVWELAFRTNRTPLEIQAYYTFALGDVSELEDYQGIVMLYQGDTLLARCDTATLRVVDEFTALPQ